MKPIKQVKILNHLMREARLVLIALGFICLPLAGLTQSENYKYYDINKIQSNELIKSISKDEKGFLWLATDHGVLRFDGKETMLYHKELPSHYTKKILKRKNDQLLILTDWGLREIVHNGDTAYFRSIQVDGKPFDQHLNYPKSMYEDSKGNLWIGEVNAVIKVSEKGFKRYFLGPQYQSINHYRTFAFTEDAFGHLWIAPYNGRLLSYNSQKDELEEVEITYPLSEVSSILTLKGDHLLIGGKEGLLMLKVDSDKRIQENRFLGGPENVMATYALNNDVYIGTWDSGLYYTDSNLKSSQYARVSELPFNDILDYYFDPQRNELWIAGSENVGLLKPSLIRPVSKVGIFRVESVTLDGANNLYYSTGRQIMKLHPAAPEKSEPIYSSKSTYLDRILGEGSKLWIGDAFGGISYYDLVQNKLYKVVDSTAQGQPIKHILQDRNGNKWFTGLVGSIVKIDPSNQVSTYPRVKNSVVIKEDQEGQLYCGAQDESSLLYVYNSAQNNFEPVPLTFNVQLSSNAYVEDIAIDSMNNLWLATNEGLIKVSKNKSTYKAERITVKGVDSNEPIKAIAIVDDNIWLAYSHALAVYNNGQAIFFTRENGLPSRLLKERCFLMHDNRLYVATAKGLAAVSIQGLAYKPTPQPLFKSVSINGKRHTIADGKSIYFPYGARVQVEFVSLSYPGGNMLYQTKLSGLEDDWSSASPNNSISVLGFSEGNYTLQVRARDNNHLWSEPLLLNFAVSAPWYKTWWAILLFTGSGILLIAGSTKVYHLHLTRQKKNLQRIIEERTKEINQQKNEIIEQKNKLIQQKEELIEKNNAVFKSQQALSEADLNYLQLKGKQLQDQLEYRNKQITTHTLNIIQKNEMLKELRDQIEGLMKSPNGVSQQELKRMLKVIDESYRLDKDWDDFKLYFEQIHTGFYAKLKINYPELTNQELRHCALIRLNLSNNECASILGISPNSIKVIRNRLRKKLNLESHHSLTDFIMSI